jgi:hypothetical protein
VTGVCPGDGGHHGPLLGHSVSETPATRPTPGFTAQEEAAAEVAARVLGATAHPSPQGDITLSYADGRWAALEEATLGDRQERPLAQLRRECDLEWPAPGRWWWQIVINDVRQLARVREIFPMTARACEARGVPTLDRLPATMTITMPDLHWLVHQVPAQLLGHPDVLDRPTTVTVSRGESSDRWMTSVVPALERCLTLGVATRTLRRLANRAGDERQLYLTVDCEGLAPEAFDALVRADGVPPSAPSLPTDCSHLWVAPVLGRTVLLWTRQAGWSRHAPYG